MTVSAAPEREIRTVGGKVVRSRRIDARERFGGLIEAASSRAFHGDAARFAPLAAAIVGAARDAEAEVLSLDVFDTALLREQKSEARRFYEISARFAETCAQEGERPRFDATDAFLARIQAARAAYGISPTLNGNREGRHGDIARIVCELLGCAEATDRYVESELAYEAAALEPSALVARVIESLGDLEIVFVSDMYLEGDKIARLLSDRLGIARPRVFSSADGNGAKRSGGLFAHVAAETGAAPGRILHVGDSLRSDFQKPRSAGWRSFYLPLPEAERAARKACHARTVARAARIGVPLERHLSFNL